MSAVAGGARAPRVTPAALQARVRRLLRPSHSTQGAARPPVLLFRGQPEWTGPAEFTAAGRVVRVVPCVSPLAVLEQVTRRAAEPGDGVLALITDADEAALGDTVLSQVYRHRVDVIESWTAVEEDFGATRMDPRLVADKWAAQALLEARPAGGWPRLAGTLLSREIALGELAVARLGLHEYGLRAADLDAVTLLRWSATFGATDAFRALGVEERAGLTEWLVSRTRRVGRALFALVEAGHGTEALALGLVCDALWAPRTGGADERAKGRVDLYFGDQHLDDMTVRAFADTARELVLTTLRSARPGASQLGIVPFGLAPASTLHPADEIPALLEAAERLLDQFGARAAGTASDLLQAGFDHRMAAIATAVRDFAAAVDAGVARSLLAQAALDVVHAVATLRRHRLADLRRERVERAAMAARVASWLATQPTRPAASTGRTSAVGIGAAPTTLAGGLDAHLADGAWVDVALGQLWAGDPADEVAAAYGALYRAAARRRHVLDAAFARELARWTVTGHAPTAGGAGQAGSNGAAREPLLVEEILDRVVAPAVHRPGGKALLVVLDGMSAAVAAQLGEDLRRARWAEYDPLGAELAGLGNDGAEDAVRTVAARRRAAVAVLPTVTTASRTSLLAGRLVEGDQAVERAAFERHPRWGGRRARLFHSRDLTGEPGAPLGRELTGELTADTPLVAVVINTVDDTLDNGRERYDAGWNVADVGPLRHVLELARTAERAVILTSDHGHVLELGGEQRRADDALSARHRSGAADGPAQVGEGEVVLAGPRVLAPGGQIVALWDPALRYTARRGGYHGGAAPAEVTVPVLAFLPFGPSARSSGRDVPPGWRSLPDQRPGWWALDQAEALSGLGGGATVLLGRGGATGTGAGGAETVVAGRKRRRPTDAPAGPALFELPAEPAASAGGASLAGGAEAAASPTPPSPVDELVAGLLASELFQEQLKSLARRADPEKIAAAVRALVEANGTLATAVVAERAGELPHRAGGFANNLQRVFNIDNYPVVESIDDGRTLRLNGTLLRQQFGLAG
ncbi:BREX-2 system phosphatase PglZ [Pseudofrankia sp. BMG5.37]|uniref:BREX-2 system phosphatase PglZ n=1 Tax=Pseudofrankia sp. BMG5.37 TaxID=3050035 RepID=UPI002893E31B|nr:BREX-2 system phosphatase PglZ [Pseudofrankia sp. BMG5.37]MDT3441473.1 BREX-2 system phosphatase PglZ [Pseudofrankia sp. BMG5.37]